MFPARPSRGAPGGESNESRTSVRLPQPRLSPSASRGTGRQTPRVRPEPEATRATETGHPGWGGPVRFGTVGGAPSRGVRFVGPGGPRAGRALRARGSGVFGTRRSGPSPRGPDLRYPGRVWPVCGGPWGSCCGPARGPRHGGCRVRSGRRAPNFPLGVRHPLFHGKEVQVYQ